MGISNVKLVARLNKPFLLLRLQRLKGVSCLTSIRDIRRALDAFSLPCAEKSARKRATFLQYTWQCRSYGDG